MSEPGLMTNVLHDPSLGNPDEEPPEQSRRQRIGDTYAKYADQFMLLVALIFLLAFFFMLVPNQSPVSRQGARDALIVTWIIFIVDYFIRVLLAPRPARYMARHPLILLSLFFPPLRVVIAIKAIIVLFSGTQGKRTLGAAQIAGWLVIVAILFGSLGEVYFEASAKGANITTYGKALWWSCVTVTTVGYGDYYPVSTGGKLVAVVLMFVGVGLISTVSATIASTLISASRRENRDRFHRSAQEKLRRIHASADAADDATPPAPESEQDTEEAIAEQEAAADPDSDEFADEQAAATMGMLVDAIDRLQQEVSALRSDRLASDAPATPSSGASVTTETHEKPDATS